MTRSASAGRRPLRVMAVVGARPNMMKIAPLLREMHRHPDLAPILVHTGQHYDARMSDAFFQDLGIPEPDRFLGVGSGTHARQTAEVMIALEPLMSDLRPDLVLVVGDVNSTMAAALVAAKLRIPLAHVEAGLRSFDRDMPEEVNRVVTDALSDLLFTTERSGNENLEREGVAPERVHLVGNVMIDTLLQQVDRARAVEAPARYGVSPGGYALLTLHRPSNVDEPRVLERLMEVVGRLQTRLPVLFPVHPRTRQRLGTGELAERLRGMPDLRLLDPLGYIEFLGLMCDARLVLTDSGGIQEETTILGVPCLTLRENTERPVTVVQGTNRVVGTDPAAIWEAAEDVLSGRELRDRSVPEMWDGKAAERIVEILRRRDPLPDPG